MKVLSVLFLGLVLCANLELSEVFAQDKSFVISSANVINVCLDKILLTNNNISINKQFHVCPQTDSVSKASSEQTQTYATTLGPNNWRDKIWFFAGTSKDNAGKIQRTVRKYKCLNPPHFCEWKPQEKIQDPLNWFFLQSIQKAEFNLNADDFSSAPPERLFVAGTQGTAGANDILSFALNAENETTGAKSTTFSNSNNKTTLGGSVSRDGGIAVQLTATSASWTLNTRKLNNGLPAKAPISWTVPAYNGYSPDITNPIEVNSGVAGASALKIRYLVYRTFRGVGTTAQQSQIVIQRIDDATGKPLEAAKPLTPFKNAFLAPAEAFQSLAIAPSGELLIFTEYSGTCKKMILKAVKLVNGTVTGAPKVVAGCGALGQSPLGYVGLDIAELPED